jgi:hypothetical protein
MEKKNDHESSNPETREERKNRGGPRSAVGKRRSRRNSLKFGIFSRIVLADESFEGTREEFEELRSDVRASVCPRDSFEEMLADALALQFLRLARVYQADVKVAPLLFHDVCDRLKRNGNENENGDAALAQFVNESGSPKVPAADLFLRYEASIWRHIDRILDRLEQWRRFRNVRAGACKVGRTKKNPGGKNGERTA